MDNQECIEWLIAIQKKYIHGGDEEYDRKRNEAIDYAIATLQTEDVAPVIHAEWIKRDDGWGDIYYDCSACNESWTTIEGTPFDNNMKYCPHCGAKMGKE